MSTLRPAAVAGLFYPNNATELRSQLSDMLAAVSVNDSETPKAIIAPHAGYVYSGPIAASVYALLKPLHATIKRVVLLGPSHRVGFKGIAASSADEFATPLGLLPVDKEAIALLSELSEVGQLDQAHAEEHSLEVQLPFLQTVLDDFTIVPLVVGDADAAAVGKVLETLWGGPETLIVISSDLSHYHDYRSAQQIDTLTSQAILDLRFEDIDHHGACGRNPISGLLVQARQRGLRSRLVDLRNSGDTAGPRDRVVGYGAYAFCE